MDIETFATGITFDTLGPLTMPDPGTVAQVVDPTPGAPLPFEVANTRLPAYQAQAEQRIAPLCGIPRMSTFAIGSLINHAVACMPADQAFVNVGVWCGFTLLSGMVGNPDKVCIGIDNFSQFTAEDTPGEPGPKDLFTPLFEGLKSPRHGFFEMDYRAYFRDIHRGAIGIYLYDGDHTYEHQLEGLRVAEPYFAPGCLILVDDTNIPDPRRATFDFATRLCRHRYRVLFDKQTLGNGHPTWWNGFMALQRIG